MRTTPETLGKVVANLVFKKELSKTEVVERLKSIFKKLMQEQDKYHDSLMWDFNKARDSFLSEKKKYQSKILAQKKHIKKLKSIKVFECAVKDGKIQIIACENCKSRK